MMKYYLGLLLVVFSIHATAQNTVKMSAVKGNNFGVSYTLPITEIVVTATITKKTRKAGEFYQYAERYLNVSNPITQDETVYTLESLNVETTGIPDKSKSYLVEFKSGSAASFVTLTKDGLICAINEELSLPKAEPRPAPQIIGSEPVTNPKAFLSEEILRAGSSAKQAELIAKQIYRLRESKTNILTGEADNMPPDGDAYKLVMSQIDNQEKALTSMFVGTEVIEAETRTFNIVPDESNIEKNIIFRFSRKLGVVEPNDLAGAPVYLTLTSKNPVPEIVMTEKEMKEWEKKFSSGIVYNIPSKANLRIEYNNQTMVQNEIDVIQFGVQEVLSGKELDNKKTPVRVIFYPELGAIKQIIQ